MASRSRPWSDESPWERRSAKRPARRPTAAEPWANGPALAQWPARVAVAAYGRYQDYGGDDNYLLMVDRCGTPGARIKVSSPKDLENWASANEVRVPITCCVLTLSR